MFQEYNNYTRQYKKKIQCIIPIPRPVLPALVVKL
jgi:hypothetical protein